MARAGRSTPLSFVHGMAWTRSDLEAALSGIRYSILATAEGESVKHSW